MQTKLCLRGRFASAESFVRFKAIGRLQPTTNYGRHLEERPAQAEQGLHPNNFVDLSL